MSRFLGAALLLVLAAISAAAVAVKKKTPAAGAKKAPAKTGKTSSTTAKKTAPKKGVTSAKAASSSAAKKRTTATRRRYYVPRAPAVSAKLRAESNEQVSEWIGGQVTFENAAALVPFFEQLFRMEKGMRQGSVPVLQYGDSHTASDDWVNTMRELLQTRFGNAGSGFSHAGRPWNGYRRYDVRSGASRRWYTDGLLGRNGDGMYGLAGVSITATYPGETASLQAEGSKFKLLYLQQPGGGAFELFDNGELIEILSTAGDTKSAAYRFQVAPGLHELMVRTRDRNPVRLFGWVAENGSNGVTFEMLGINGANAPMILNWEPQVLAANVAERNPALIILAYGTNEAGNKDWTEESYRDAFGKVLEKLRAAAPAASILVVGPPDRWVRTRAGWKPYDAVDRIVNAQRAAAMAANCAFLDLRSKMGEKGSMRTWVLAGLAQGDYVHLTGAGYRLLGETLYRELMAHYDLFLRVRE